MLAADQRITWWARQLRQAGLDGGMDLLRARAFLDILLGIDSRPLGTRTSNDPAQDSAPGKDGNPGHDAKPRQTRPADEPGPDSGPVTTAVPARMAGLVRGGPGCRLRPGRWPG